jgi:hypothetical protein
MTCVRLRSLLVTCLVTGLVAAGALPAAADDSLDELLDEIEDAEFSGSQVIITTWDGVTEVSVVTVDHGDGIVIVEGGDGVAMLGQGRAMRLGAGNGAAVSDWTEVSSERYRVLIGRVSLRQGRDVQSVEIREGDLLRARVTLDVESGAPLVTEVFDGAGRRFRYSAMLDFEPWSQGVAAPGTHVFDVSVPAESSARDELAGYVRADTYAAPDDSLHSFYSDGLFAFSLFEYDGPADFGEDALESFEISGRRYERRVTATDVYVTWPSSGSTYVLVGDLPPDHLADVLDELPQPRRRGFLSRLWDGLFG